MSIVRDTRSGRFRGVRGDRAGAKSYRSAPAARRSLDLDGCLAFGLLTSTLFILQLGAAGAGVFSGLVLLYGLLRGRELSRSFRWRAVLLAIPLLAILSAYWSEAAGQSLKLGVEYGLTAIAGLLLSASLRPKSVLIGIFLAFMVYLIASLLLGGAVAVGAGGDTAFAGLNQSKNLLGDICSTGALVSLALVVVFLSPAERNPWLAGLGAVGAAAEVVMLVSTRSSGAVAGLALGIVAFGVLVGLTAANRSTRAFLTVGLSAMVVAGGLLSQQISKLLVALGASAFNKDSTLTGRTYLWRRAHDLIAEKPWVGRGYSAFWVQGNPDAEGLWRYGGITERG